MQRGLRTEIQRLGLFLAFSLFLGWLVGMPFQCLLVGSVLYGMFLLQQMQRFYLWLANHSADIPPASSGVWGDISDAIYRMRKAQEQQQQDLLKQLTRMQDSTAALKDGVVLVDNRGQIEFWNDAAGVLLGLRRNADEHQILTNLLRDPLFVDYYRNAGYVEPFVIHSPINSESFLEIQINVFGDNEKLMVVRDVTRLQKLEKVRSEFVANVSHELRTPLTVLKGYLETLVDQRDMLDPRWGKALDHMQQQAARMQNLIDDLTLLSRLESRNTGSERSRVIIPVLAQRIVDDAHHLFPQHKIKLEGPMLAIDGNETELHSAFSNLLTNALRYSPAGSQVCLHWGLDEHSMFFSVQDQGPGIAAVHLPRLTERFYRIDAGRGRADGGTGLGLAIVKHALARHDALLEIKSTVGKGSEFTCRFPLALVREN
ncbi:MAG TPA: phosphate regulon sensor histidine kinase PhoR [Pseudomonadales bacterium]|nr:phosphate regulon sensor histidine kinase PhoR [Pseudomonadales bacterium]